MTPRSEMILNYIAVYTYKWYSFTRSGWLFAHISDQLIDGQSKHGYEDNSKVDYNGNDSKTHIKRTCRIDMSISDAKVICRIVENKHHSKNAHKQIKVCKGYQCCTV